MTDAHGRKSDVNFSRDAETFRASGMEPPWERVWRDGVDVTDKPELWPELWTNPGRYRRRRKG